MQKKKAGRKKRAEGKRGRPGYSVSRWLVLPLGLGLAGAAAYLVLTSRPPARQASAPGTAVGSPDDPHAEIRERSRERLREILRDEDGGPDGE